ncbi:phosphomethylpyrimidine synthase ThiC, partial [Clostridioides difficile]|uniref:phosphomethylpyrimidine synthase ThiC n=1 Tax=Clostridioides difficile TaxID=1496 RepID=UPI001F19AAAB
SMQTIKNLHEILYESISHDFLFFAWMELNNKENPIYTNFDKILDICEEYDVTLSLGDACRPGCIKDST